jgi:sulfur relay (sulfurtransferase) DsrC/TusE family protein
MSRFARQFQDWKKELANILDSDTVVTMILKHWNAFNLLVDQVMHQYEHSTKEDMKIEYVDLMTCIFYDEYLSEYLQFVFDHLQQFVEKERDVASKQSFVQFVKYRFSPRPLSEMCCKIITKRVSNVTDLSEVLPVNLIAVLQNHNDMRLNFQATLP